MTPADAARPAGNVFDSAEARRRCLRYRRRILDMSQQVGALHVAPAFSCLEMVDLVYHGLLRDPRAHGRDAPDMFLMSKGHGCLSQYVVLEDLGVLARQDLERYCTPDGRLGAHPDYGVPGIAASTGSLGHGMGMAVGMAYGDRLLGRGGTMFVLLSDGELQEGSSWEAMMMAANLDLGNLVAFVDLNDFQGLGRTSESHPHVYPVAEKLRSFGWEAAEVNGHDAGAMWSAIQARGRVRPFMVIARTVKGRGVSFMENVPIWHYRSPSPAEHARAVAELVEIGS